MNFTNVGMDGGLAPNFSSNEECITHILEAVNNTGHSEKVQLGIDAGASKFYYQDKKIYDMNYKRKSQPSDNYSIDDMLIYYRNLLEKYPIISLEDPFDQNDWEGYQEITKLLGENVKKFLNISSDSNCS